VVIQVKRLQRFHSLQKSEIVKHLPFLFRFLTSRYRQHANDNFFTAFIAVMSLLSDTFPERLFSCKVKHSVLFFLIVAFGINSFQKHPLENDIE